MERKESFYKIGVSRRYYFKVPFAWVLENQKDFTHFSHLHRKVILDYRLLYKKGSRAIFLYKARRLYPFPFYDSYIVFREFTEDGYYQLYLNTKSGAIHYLKGIAEDHGDRASQTGEFVFSMPRYWRFFPKFFFWIFKRRMTQVVQEDYQLFEERLASGSPVDSPACAPTVPENFDLLEELFKKGVLPDADINFNENKDHSPLDWISRGNLK